MLDSTEALFFHCKRGPPGSVTHPTKPLFVQLFKPISQPSIRFLDPFNQLYSYFSDFYDGSEQLLIFTLDA